MADNGKKCKCICGGKPVICTCDCHKDGNDILHFEACCSLCYKKYINEDGSVNEGKYRTLLLKHVNEVIKKNTKR